jgi:hypothetical protein
MIKKIRLEALAQMGVGHSMKIQDSVALTLFLAAKASESQIVIRTNFLLPLAI